MAMKDLFLKSVKWQDAQKKGKAGAPDRDRLIRALIDSSSEGDLIQLDAQKINQFCNDILRDDAKRKKGEINLDIKSYTHPSTQTFHAIRILCDDFPFLVSTINNALLALQIKPRILLHSTLEREGRTKISACWLHVLRGGDEQIKNLKKTLKIGLHDNAKAVADWQKMQHRMQETISYLRESHSPDHKEAIALCQWMLEDNFTFTGFRQHLYSGTGKGDPILSIPAKRGLGILRKNSFVLFEDLSDGAPLPKDHITNSDALVKICKANIISTVHRRKHIDVVIIKKTDSKGNIVGRDIFSGLFTSNAYMNNIRSIPFLRIKMDYLSQEMDIEKSSHNARILEHILNTYPRDDLWQINDDVLCQHCTALVEIMEHPKLRLLVRRDPSDRFIIAHIYIPRDAYEMQLRDMMTKTLEHYFAGTVTAFDVRISDDILARMILVVKTQSGEIPDYDEREIEAILSEIARPWKEKLEKPLSDHFGCERSYPLLHHYGTAFSTTYRTRFQAEDAISDIVMILEAQNNPDGIVFDFQRDTQAAPNHALLKIFRIGEPVVLSDFMPFLDSSGLKALSEESYLITPQGKEDVFLHVFLLKTPDGLDVAATKNALVTMLRALRDTPSENDLLNSLILTGLSWPEITLLRALVAYMLQGNFSLPNSLVRGCLTKHHSLIRDMIALFHSMLHPRKSDAKVEKKINTRIDTQLSAVSSLEEDRILRAFLSIIRAIQRTNFYQGSEKGKPFITLKIASPQVNFLPAPRPLVEIFVYSPRFEAVHLRFGKVARGGLRWSDRRADFRTEILGLVKAQQVKNSVIIPVGSKGGFVPKNNLTDRKEFIDEGIACYSLFINAMLDITDNLEKQKILPPKDVVRRDGDDPYLVVAADKGTATLSDTANGIAVEKGFWLGDAFASGGSAGYDHKKMGITARGAWESVKHHFWKIDHDTQSQPFDVIGVGDMSGDVFGNGMLLSEHIRLIAAFNHLHIFIDPAPDTTKSFAERQRLFALPRSSWQDYNASLLSKGGGIFSRQEKSLTLPSEIQERFEIKEKSVTPDQFICAILRAKTDLLWFGGIGTYIKTQEESNDDVSDHANDAVRINARELRATVIGEGANLGMTQKARIAFARKGGRCNNDAVDNSAGVDCSDHEVNIKILLNDAITSGSLAEKNRNALLETMTPAVGIHVLRNNYQQNQILSMIESRNYEFLDAHQQLIRNFERHGHLDRTIESLPNDEDIDELRRAGKGLSRPELCVLLAYTKNIAYQEILESPLPDDDFLEFVLMAYFPENLHKPFYDSITHHQLHREIIATWLSNNLVNDAGITLVGELQRRKNISIAKIARAWLIVRGIFNIPEIKKQIGSLDVNIPAQTQTRMLFEIGQLIFRASEWVLTYEDKGDITAIIDKYRAEFSTLASSLESLLGKSLLEDMQERQQRFSAPNVPASLFKTLGSLKMRSTFCDIIRIAHSNKMNALDTAKCYFAFSERFMFDRIRSGTNALPVKNRWERMARNAIISDLWSLQARLTQQAMQKAKKPEGAMEEWLSKNDQSIQNIDTINNEIYLTGALDLPKAIIATRILGELSG